MSVANAKIVFPNEEIYQHLHLNTIEKYIKESNNGSYINGRVTNGYLFCEKKYDSKNQEIIIPFYLSMRASYSHEKFGRNLYTTVGNVIESFLEKKENIELIGISVRDRTSFQPTDDELRMCIRFFEEMKGDCKMQYRNNILLTQGFPLIFRTFPPDFKDKSAYVAKEPLKRKDLWEIILDDTDQEIKDMWGFIKKYAYLNGTSLEQEFVRYHLDALGEVKKCQ